MKPIHAIIAVLFVASGLALGACSGSTEDTTTDAGTTADAGTKADAGTNADAGTTTDAGSTAECTGSCSHDGSNDCECFLNADCAPTFRCESKEGDLTGTCKCGARGTKAYDAACANSNECESGICADGWCTKECAADADCSGAKLTKCNAFAGICILPT